MVLWVLMSNLIWTKPSANFYTGMKISASQIRTHWQSEIAAERARHCERTMKGKIWSNIRESRGGGFGKLFLVVLFISFFFPPPLPLPLGFSPCPLPPPLSLVVPVLSWEELVMLSYRCVFLASKHRNTSFAVPFSCTWTRSVYPIAPLTSIIIKWRPIASRHLNSPRANSIPGPWWPLPLPPC